MHSIDRTFFTAGVVSLLIGFTCFSFLGGANDGQQRLRGRDICASTQIRDLAWRALKFKEPTAKQWRYIGAYSSNPLQL
jgi:hypothetical protein